MALLRGQQEQRRQRLRGAVDAVGTRLYFTPLRWVMTGVAGSCRPAAEAACVRTCQQMHAPLLPLQGHITERVGAAGGLVGERAAS